MNFVSYYNIIFKKADKITQVFVEINKQYEKYAANPGQSGYDRYVTKIPAGRVGDPKEVAQLIEFLISDDAVYIVEPPFLSMADFWLINLLI